MKPISNVFAAVVFSLSFVFVVGIATPSTHAQFAQACGCGSAKCGGCLKGKMFPVKKLAHQIGAKANCACEACQAKTVSPPTVTSDVLISTEYLPAVSPTVVAPCGCGKKNCGCKLRRPNLLKSTRSCPQCDCDFCELKVSKSKEEKTCFEVKQKEVCIPAVRLPWKKNCPPTRSKVRVVNVLSKKKYECPSCKYEWNVYEPEVPESPKSASNKSILDSSKSEASSNAETAPIKEVDPVEPVAPKMNVPEPPNVKELKLDTVPRPPVEDAS